MTNNNKSEVSHFSYFLYLFLGTKCKGMILIPLYITCRCDHFALRAVCIKESSICGRRERDALGRIFAISAKGNNACNFLFAFIHTKSILKKGLL